MSTRPPETPDSEPPPPPNTVVPHVLCDCCSRIVKKSKIIQALSDNRLDQYLRTKGSNYDEESFFHNRSLSYLSKSSAAGCHLCSLAMRSDTDGGNYQSIVAVLVYEEIGEDMSKIGEDMSIYLVFARASIDVAEELLNDFDCMDSEIERLGTNLNLSETLSSLFRLTRIMGEDQREAYYLAAGTPDQDANFSTSTNSLETMSTVRSWIDLCIRNHPECSRNAFSTNSTEYGRFPTRLIDVGKADGELAPRLILTSTSMSPTIKYLTLSHSWSITSTKSTLKLTSGNIQHLQKQIPVKDLPRTFQDAMDLTRRLGYRYIWIDSLCIMQDSESDWHREALTMSSVYGNSSCNIAALGIDGADTCYVQRNPLRVFPCRITQQKDMGSVYAAGLSELRDTSNVPLLRRGWIMQERLLSPRVLYIGAEEMFWECCSRTASEDLPSSTRQERLRSEHASNWAGFLKALEYCTKSDFELLCGHKTSEPESNKVPQGLPCGRQDPKFTFAQAWLRIVRDYQKTEFTYESDRLIALSGVAKAIEHSKGFTYVAGTWKELWPIDLLWSYDGAGIAKQEPRNLSISKVPSWSWAAMRGNKTFLSLDSWFHTVQITYLAQVIEFTSPTSTARYTGTEADEERITLTLKGGVERGVVSAYHFATLPFKDFSVQLGDGFKYFSIYWDHTPEVGDSVLLLLLMRGNGSPGPFLGLVLMLEEGAQNRHGQLCYRRVGFFRNYYSRKVFEDHNEPWGEEETVCLC